MSEIDIILLIIFIVSSIVGYILIKNVPSLLHTPLMSGMNALSGITVIGALLALAIAYRDYSIFSAIAACVAVIIATINVVGGFGITHRMLKMFKKKDLEDE
ncbi:MAG: NAD(P) transhydrogenase subunit alpha [Acholeplasmataceae bacterium]|jgi:NAD(P) transhydrogenase subunit alpha|nr:NAD(P) transhydrogenase subunit alpha [Acholeplasmataceae bacterium]